MKLDEIPSKLLFLREFLSKDFPINTRRSFVTSAIFKFRKYRKDTLPTCFFGKFAVAFIENTRKSIYKRLCIVLIGLSVFVELNGILHETKHLSFDPDIIPPLQRAVNISIKTSTKKLEFF